MARTRLASADVQPPFRTLPAAALRACLREGYGLADLRGDVLAGLVVGVVALPLSMALSIAVGLPPQHGLYTAIVAGLAVAMLGGSRTQVTGPTAAFVVILAPIYARFGLGGLLTAGMMAGVILVAMAVARLGKLLQFIPHPVTTGFTAGIGTVIATMELKDFFGLTVPSMPEHYLERVAAIARALPSTVPAELGVGAITLAVLVFFPRITRRVPSPLIAVFGVAAATAILHALVPSFTVRTIGSVFHATIGGHEVAGIPQEPPLPGLPWGFVTSGGQGFQLSWATIRALVPSAFAIAALGAIESLLSAVVSDGMAGTRHDPDAELLALGVGNVLCPFFGGIPCTGAIARTGTNIRAGGKTPVAAIVHAVFVLATLLALAPLLGYVPMASLAALLLLVAWNMSDAKHFLHTVRVAPKSDVAVLLTCYGLTVVFDMTIGVSVGIVLAALLFMKRMADVTKTELLSTHPRVGAVPDDVVLYDIAGPLFFGAAEKAVGSLHAIKSPAKVVILDLDEVAAMDATGLVALESALVRLERDGRFAILCGVRPQPAALIERAGVGEVPGKRAVVPDLESALRLARERVAASSSGAAATRIPAAAT